MKLIGTFVLALVLSGCMSSTSPSTGVQTTEYVCAASTAALKTAITFNAKLTPAQRADVTKATLVIDPVCSQPMVPTLSSTAQAALTGALTTLTTIATAVQK